MAYDAFHHEELSTNLYRRIGFGSCGSVWTSTDTTAMKREDCGRGRSLLKDFNMHRLLLESYTHCPSDLKTFHIPACYGFTEGDYAGWETTNILSRFPEGEVYLPCNTLIAERIPPFPQRVRNRIIDEYCPSSIVEKVKEDTNNRDCLIRPYLGRRRRGYKSRLCVFNLRNYPLHVNNMKDLGLDPSVYSKIMAQTLAFMYWLAKVDANDVEFVLAPAEGAVQFTSEGLGDHNMWILDFDLCRSMSMDLSGVEQAAEAFLGNDPFFPRPSRGQEEEDEDIWKQFKAAFLEASLTVIRQAASDVPEDLPQLLLDTIESKAKTSTNS
ncbi:zinc finger protein-domain-containing protein [Astrocystis sublimbata]|nr:zinc finger protein-domain-containing protein [Astrocystis sublimbata]